MLGFKTDYEEERRSRKVLELTERAYQVNAVNKSTGEKEKVWRLQIIAPITEINHFKKKIWKSGIGSLGWRLCFRWNRWTKRKYGCNIHS